MRLMSKKLLVLSTALMLLMTACGGSAAIPTPMPVVPPFPGQPFVVENIATAKALRGRPTPTKKPRATWTPRPYVYVSTTDLEIQTFTCQEETFGGSSGYASVIGEVKNTSGKPLENVMAVGNWYTATEEFIVSDSALLTFNPIMPDQISPFKTMSTFNPLMTNCELHFTELFGTTMSSRLRPTATPTPTPVPAVIKGRIAFRSNRDGNYEIYVRNADGSGQTNLTNNPAGDFEPTWSPDGEKIAFRSNRDGNEEIYVMNADGSDLTRLTILTVSMDLPFVQARWCGAHEVDKVEIVSDFKSREFGDSYGVHVKENGLLARAVFVIGKDDIVKHVEYVPIISQLPDFNAALDAAKAAAG